MTVGKLVHYAFDLVLISVILASIKKNTGLELNITGRPDGTGSGASILKFLQFGEGVYSTILSFAKRSNYFRRATLRNRDDIKDRVRNEVGDLIDRV